MESDCEVPSKKRRRSKPRVVKDWDEDDVFKLIALVEGLPCLWNVGDDGYHNKIVRNNAWRSISAQFDGKYGPVDLNAKWTNLRIQYRGYAGRSKTKGAVEPKWRFFNAISFVGQAQAGYQQTQPTVSNMVSDTESNSNSLDCSTPPLSTPRRPNVVSNTQTVAAIKERNNNALEANVSFANYLLSELNTQRAEAAASVRKKVVLYFLQCIEEEKEKSRVQKNTHTV